MGQYIEENKWDRSKVRQFGICHDDPKITPESKLRYDAAILPPSRGKERGEVGHQTASRDLYKSDHSDASIVTLTKQCC
jgi:DNA gyrase inhibitor GyrI